MGNYGTNAGDDEAATPYIEGLVVREWAEAPSSWRSDATAEEFLRRSDVPAISGIDSRALVRELRIGGVMQGALSRAGLDLATRVSTKERNEPRFGSLDAAHAGRPIVRNHGRYFLLESPRHV